jgi:hypothetical protein
MQKQFYTTKEAADDIGVTYAQLTSAMFRGSIKRPAQSAGRSVLFTPTELDAARQFFARKESDGRDQQSN